MFGSNDTMSQCIRFADAQCVNSQGSHGTGKTSNIDFHFSCLEKHRQLK